MADLMTGRALPSGHRFPAARRAGGFNLIGGSNNIDIGNEGGPSGESGRIRIGTKGDQAAAYLQGVYNKTSGGGVPVVINSAGKLGTATAASAKTSAGKPFSAAAGRRLLATVERQQRQIERQGKEIRALRAQGG